MNKRILVPLDGSRLAEMVLPSAVGIALASGYDLTLLRVATAPAPISSIAWSIAGMAPATNMLEGWDDELKAERHYLETIAGCLGSKGVDARTELLEDEPAPGIVSYVERHPDVVLIAMSTHGRSGLGRWMLGSVAEKVLHASPVPLLLVRPEHEEGLLGDFGVPEYKSLLVPLDGSILAAQALDMAKPLAATLHTTLTLVSAVPEQPSVGDLATSLVAPAQWVDESLALANYLQQNQRNLEAEGFLVRTRLEDGPPAEAILRVADSSLADLIVMASHGRTGLSRFWLGSVAMKVVQASPPHRSCPVLLVRAKERVKEPDHERAGTAITLAMAM